MSLSWQLATRFRRARKNGFISFVSFSSTAGIGLGCFVLIVMLSVMNGFERELKNRILAVVPHGELYSIDNTGIVNWPEVKDSLAKDESVLRITPFTQITGMVQFKGQLKAVALNGLQVDEVKRIAKTGQISTEDLSSFESEQKTVLLGRTVARELQVKKGDNVQFLMPVITRDLSFKAPKTISLTVAGIVSVGGELDSAIGLMHLNTASTSAMVESGAKGLRFTFHDPFIARQAIARIGYNFAQPVYMSDWTRTQGHLYNDIQLVRVVVYIALTLVIAVACFNIVSSLVMAVRDKRSAIAILKTMGASDSLIRNSFMLQGSINGVLGTALGTALACVVSPNLSLIVSTLERWFDVSVLSGDIYFIDFLPSHLMWSDVFITVVVAMTLAIFATVYPAIKASRANPVEGLQ